MDVDAQARPLFERLAADLAQLVKRVDVDYYLKAPSNPQPGNDQLAFYCMVPGYYPATGSSSPVSVIAYRVNSGNKLERMAKGLLWNGVSPSSTPLLFLPATISGSWPAATNANSDSDYEAVGPYIFRFEYYYLLKTGTVSTVPWDTLLGHTGVQGMQDVAAISISMAAIDPKSRVLVSDVQLAGFAGRMSDFTESMRSGDLLAQWQSAVDATTDLARPAAAAVRLYQRQFNLAPKL
jgi:hypothetical protein